MSHSPNPEPRALNPRAILSKLAERGRAGDLRMLAKRLGLPIVATNDVHCLTIEDYLTHCILTAIRENVLLSELQPSQIAHPEAYLKSPEEMADLFSYIPEAVRNTRRIAEECNFEWPMGKPIFPKADLPTGETAASYLRNITYRGAEERYGKGYGKGVRSLFCEAPFGPFREKAPDPFSPEVRARLNHELEVIEKLGFSGYFIIVWEIVEAARARGIPIVGRGSAADSLVSYCLGITRADPLHYNLYFERFLNPARTDPPDIDLDMCWRRRDEVIDYIYRRYGADHVAMVANHNLYQARSAFRDVARVFGLPLAEIDDLSKALPHDSVANIRELIRLYPEWRRFPINEEPYRTIISMAERIDHFPRHLGIHVGGLVIGERPLTDYVPLERATKGIVITQYDMDPIEKIGLVKMDVLGQRSLSAIHDAAEAVRRRGIALDLDAIPDGDPAVAKMASEGRTLGCFQIESPGMRNLLKMMRARSRDDLIVALSLIRPGPSASGMKERYIRRRLGLEKTVYPCPELEPVLRETYGILLYQEHILKVAEAVAGFTLTDGDELRKAITKERSPERIEALRGRFCAGAARRGMPPKIVNEIWENIVHFAGFSFNKAHAVTYGQLAYQALYLKSHYPAEFMAAVMSNLAGYYEPRVHLEEARRLGVRILLPDINESEYRHQPHLLPFLNPEPRTPACEPHLRLSARGAGRQPSVSIRLGFMQVRELAGSTVDAILKARERRPFTSLRDFLSRVRISKPEAENLILCGAFDSLGVTRPSMLWELYAEAKPSRPHVARPHSAVLVGAGLKPAPTTELWATTPLHDPSATSFSNLRATPDDYTKDKKVQHELEILGMAVSEHPMYLFRERVAPFKPMPCAEVPRHVARLVTVAGIVDCTRRTATSDNKPMFFLTLEDESGMVEVVLFPDVYQRFGHLLAESGVLLVKGRVESQLGAVTIAAEWMKAL
jgi:DNA-directed DNA polymerase III PolC